MVCLSGGKDSYALLDILLSLRERARPPFDIVAVNLDQKQPGFPADVLPEYLKRRGVPFHIEEQDTYSVVKRTCPKARPCAACARGCAAASCTAWPRTGRHQDRAGPPPRRHGGDAADEHVLRQPLKGMPPKLVSDDGKNVVIRPLAYVAESRPGALGRAPAVPHHPVHAVRQPGQPAAGAGQGHDPRLGAQYPGRIDNMLTAMGNVVPVAPDGPEPLPLHHDQSHRAWPTPKATSPSTTNPAPPRRRRWRARGAPCTPCRDLRRNRMKHHAPWPWLALLAPLWLLAGCAALRSVSSDVSSFGDWPAGRANPAPTPSSACPRSRPGRPGRRAGGRGAARWPRPASSPRRPAGARRAGAAGRAHRHAPTCRPGTTRSGGAAASALTATARGSARAGAWACSWTARYEREVALLIRDRASGKPLFEARASNEGNSVGRQRPRWRHVPGRADGLSAPGHQPAPRGGDAATNKRSGGPAQPESALQPAPRASAGRPPSP
jgi:hypothetical protein